jgi:hypothetical protein
MLRSFLMAVAMLATVTTAANAAKDLPECSNSEVQDTLQRVTRSIKVITSANVNSKNVTVERWCMAKIITANSSFFEVAFTLRWVSEGENRYWLQTQGSRRL